MKRGDVYVGLDGHEIALSAPDAEEQRLVSRLRRRARAHPDWNDFDNYWLREVAAFYAARGVSRKRSRETPVFRIGQDLSGRLGIASGLVSPDDYRGDLEELIYTKFRSQRAFCQATGLSEDRLSHVLAGRKDLSLSTLQAALARIGYRLQIRPAPAIKPPQARKRTG
jgi:hypothetical protein